MRETSTFDDMFSVSELWHPFLVSFLKRPLEVVVLPGIVQRHVLYLGEINDDKKWCRTIEAFDEDGRQARQIALFPEDRLALTLNCDVVHARLSGRRLHRPRQWSAG